MHPDLDKAVGPGAVLAGDRRTFSVMTLVGGFAGALAYGLVFELFNGSQAGLANGLVLTFGLGPVAKVGVGLMESMELLDGEGR